jgi:hypothetical protein
MLLMLKEGGTLGIDGNPIDEDIDLLPDAGGANGKLTLIETQTLASAQAEFTFSSLQADTFDTHILIGELAVDGTDGSQYEIRMQYSIGGTREVTGNQYEHRYVQIKGGSGSRSTRQSTGNFHLLREQFDDPANAKSFNIYNTIHNLGSSTLGATQEFRGNSHSSASNSRQSVGGFNFKLVGIVDTIHVYSTATNGFATGSRLSLYGVAV